MTEVAIKWEAKGKSRLPAIADQLSIPLQEIAKMLIPLMGRRVNLGVSATGHFSPMGRNPPKGGRGLWWVAPGTPQPAGWIVKPTKGPWEGWAGYESYHAWLAARGILGKPRNFHETGELWDSLRFRVLSADKVRIAFYGKHKYRPPPMPVGGGTPQWQSRAGTRVKPANQGKRGEAKFYSNSEIAFLASRNEADPMLMPSEPEVRQVMALYQNNVNAQLVALSAEGGQVQKMSRRATQLERRRTALELSR
jgi:hypothetical protein